MPWNKGLGKMNLVEAGLMLVTLTMLFGNNLNSYAIIIFCVLALLSNPVKEKILYLKKNLWLWLIPVLYFGWIAIRFLWDSSPDRSTALLEGYASLVAFPLILGSIRPVQGATLKRVGVVFVFVNIAASFYCLYESYLKYMEAKNFTGFFFYHYLSMHIGLNAIYYSMFCLFCLLILVNYFFLKKVSAGSRGLAILAAVYLLFFMVLLSSKMFLFLLCLSGIGTIGYACIYFRKPLIGVISIIIFFAAILLMVTKFSYTRSRIDEMKIKSYSGSVDNYNGAAVRSLLWHSALGLINKGNAVPVFGMGRYTAQDSLRQRYQQAGFIAGVKENFNTHNQYLYTWMCYGVIGLLLLISFLCRSFVAACQKKSYLGISLTLMFAVANLTECMVETQKGIVFFLFFSVLLSIHYTSPPSMRKTS